MAIEKPAPWIGASGTAYTFYVFDLHPEIPSRPGTFIYAKRNAEGAWVPVYMGHGDLALRCTDPDRRRCIEARSATHVHLRLNSREADREAELGDLLAHYANAFAPEGCQPLPDAKTGMPAAVEEAAPKPKVKKVTGKRRAAGTAATATTKRKAKPAGAQPK